MAGEPNRRLTDARLDAGLTQGQLAELANREVELATGRVGAMDADYISKLERGVHTWPNKRYRHALRAVLGIASDRDIGFFSARWMRGNDVRRADFLRLPGVAVAGTVAGLPVAGPTANATAVAAVGEVTERHCAQWLAWELWQRAAPAVHVSELPPPVARYLGGLDEAGRFTAGRLSVSPEGFIVGDRDGYYSFVESSFVDFFVGQRVFCGIRDGQSRLLASAQTTHAADLVIQELVRRHPASIDVLVRWMLRPGNPVLRVNSAGILAKLGVASVGDSVIATLKRNRDTRQLYLTAVVSRVLSMPWEHATGIAATVETGASATEHSDGLPDEHTARLAAEIGNPRDSAARWCSAVLLGSRDRNGHDRVRKALSHALRDEPCRENLRTLGGILAGNDPLTV